MTIQSNLHDNNEKNINLILDNDQLNTNPEFILSLKQWKQQNKPYQPIKITHLSMNNGIALFSGIINSQVESLWVWNLNGIDPIEQINIQNSELENKCIQFISLCPLGVHALISLSDGHNYYLNVEKKNRTYASLASKNCIERLSNVAISSIAWNKEKNI